MVAEKPERRRFRFSLKTLLIVFTASMVPLAWVGWNLEQGRRRLAAITWVEKMGGSVQFKETSSSRALDRWFGGNVRAVHLSNTSANDAGLRHIKVLTDLNELNLDGTNVTDAGLLHVQELTKLEWLGLVDTNVTDAGLEHLKGLTNLQTLNLGTAHTTDAGVMMLQKALPNCKIRRLPDTF